MAGLYIVVPIHNAAKYLPGFLNSLKSQSHNCFELVVFDDGSVDDSLTIIDNLFPEAKVIRGDGNCWWSKSVNEGIRFAQKNNCGYVLLLNVDVELDPEYLAIMMKQIDGRNDMILGSAQYDISSRKLCSLGGVRNWLVAKDRKNLDCYNNIKGSLVPVSHFCGRGLLIPSKVFDKIGLFAENSFPQYFADDVFTFTACRNGFRVFCNTDAKLYSYTEETGLTQFMKKCSLRNFYYYLTHIKSSGNLKIRLKAALRIAPAKFLIPYIFMDTIGTIGGYLICWFKQKARIDKQI